MGRERLGQVPQRIFLEEKVGASREKMKKGLLGYSGKGNYEKYQGMRGILGNGNHVWEQRLCVKFMFTNVLCASLRDIINI